MVLIFDKKLKKEIERDVKRQMKKEGFVCCICGRKSYGWGDKKQYGNNPSPLKEKGECCDLCNLKVTEERIRRIVYGKRT